MAKKRKIPQPNVEQLNADQQNTDSSSDNTINISETSLTVTETDEGTVSELREIKASFTPDNVIKTRH